MVNHMMIDGFLETYDEMKEYSEICDFQKHRTRHCNVS